MTNNDPLTLHECCLNRDTLRLISLLEIDADIDKKDDMGVTPLHIAAREDYQEGLELLLERGADVNVQSMYGATPLHYGIKSCDVVKALLNKGASPNYSDKFGETPLIVALRNGIMPVLKLLLSVDVDLLEENIHLYLPLHMAVNTDSHDIIKILVDKGVNIDAQCRKGLTPLHLSVQKNDCLAAQLLLDLGANPDLTDELDECLQKKYSTTEKIPPFYRTYGYGYTPLHYAANNKFSSVMKVLLNGGANPNIRDRTNEGQSPLHISTFSGDLESVRLLLENNADVHIKESFLERTPLHLAALGKEPLMIDTLIHAGANVNIRNRVGSTALHNAVIALAPKNVERLLLVGALVNAKNKNGDTPLHIATVKRGSRSTEVIKILLDWGASVNVIDYNYKTALDFASLSQLDVLKKHVAKLLAINDHQYKVYSNIDLKGYESFHTSCLMELEQMKKRRCGKYSFYDIFCLYTNPHYVNETSLENELTLFEAEFPIYGSLLKVTFKKAKKRYNLMYKVLEWFSLNILPVEIKWKIVTFLSDEDLENALKLSEEN